MNPLIVSDCVASAKKIRSKCNYPKKSLFFTSDTVKSIPQHSDTELCRLVQTRNERAGAAFEELYDRLSPRVFRYCRRVLGHQELAEDIFQETFIRFYNSLNQERSMTNVPAYVLKIARNLCLNAKSSKYYGLAPLEELHLPSSDDSYENNELVEIVKSAVECLPLEYREAYVLREYDGMAYPEIAEILDLSEATVKIRIFRARKRLRKILTPYLADLS